MRVVVIGSGFGGLAAAIRLQQQGHEVTIDEHRDKPGGRAYTYEFLQACVKPKLFISGTEDPFGPVAALERVVDLAAPPKQLVLIEGTEHFFVGKLDQMQGAVRSWVASNL